MHGIIIICLILGVLALLGGMRILIAWKWFKGTEEAFHTIWLDKRMYWISLVYAVTVILIFWLGNRWRTEIGSAYVRYFDMVITYFLLAAVDIRKKIVPNEILLCYLAGQMLMIVAFALPEIWIRSWMGGIVLSVLFGILAWFSKGGLGLGDVKLLGVTALTAGWMYTIQVVCLALVPSFVYSIWALAVCHKGRKMEIPFVPFLLVGMMLQLWWQCMS